MDRLPVKIGVQTMQTMFTGSGPPVTIWRIPFTTETGVEAYVEVEQRDYNAAIVAAKIKEQLKAITEVERLGL